MYRSATLTVSSTIKRHYECAWRIWRSCQHIHRRLLPETHNRREGTGTSTFGSKTGAFGRPDNTSTTGTGLFGQLATGLFARNYDDGHYRVWERRQLVWRQTIGLHSTVATAVLVHFVFEIDGARGPWEVNGKRTIGVHTITVAPGRDRKKIRKAARMSAEQVAA
ncbi:hypothetical protein EST38_g6993 [Candolleomyces aberdarensis]|uniref:Uncharacterized protein n=1 Tax=Candolleomyces aberdarensis TaxID=2316362 RepID=A0A4Q2DI98_9AGAR|nr:hypothetical protein EST38_g6993 [Candolleomyces aberdarensis]